MRRPPQHLAAVAVCLALTAASGCSDDESFFDAAFTEGSYSQAVLAPDGSDRIAYVRPATSFDEFMNGADSSIRVASVSGAQARTVGVGLSPCWSPTGQEIAYTTGGRLWIANVADGTNRLIESVENVRDPKWSPSGQYILVYRTLDDGLDSYILVAPVGHVIIDSFLSFETATWKSDETEIAATGYSGLYVFSSTNPWGGYDLIFSANPDRIGDAEWRPGSDEIAVLRIPQDSRMPTTVWLVDRNTQTARSLGLIGERCSWSGDGAELIVERRVGAAVEIWIHHLESGESRRFEEAR